MDVTNAADGSEAEKWSAIRTAYEARELTIAKIGEQFSVSRSAIEYRQRTEGWISRSRTVTSRSKIIARLYRILDWQSAHMEKNMETLGSTAFAELGNITRTLEKLIQLSKAETRRTAHRRVNSPEMNKLRETLADRIEQLNQG
jgi:hypothetical protein